MKENNKKKYIKATPQGLKALAGLKVIILSIILANFSPLFAQKKIAYNPEQVFLPSQIAQDAALLQQILYDFHPNIFHYTPKDSVDLYFDKLKKTEAFLNERQFRILLRQAVAKIRCGHTNIIPSQQFIDYYLKYEPCFLPFEVYYADNKLRITENLSNDSTIQIGDELLEVNKIPVQKLIAQILEIESSDAFNETGKVQTVQAGFRYFCSLLIGVRNDFLVTIKSPNDSIRQLCVSEKTELPLPKTIENKSKIKEENVQKNSRQTAQNQWTIWQSHRRLRIDTLHKKTAVLQIEDFEGSRYKKFYKQVFQQLAEQKTENLVIDLRNNSGGKVAHVGHLLSYLLDQSFDYQFKRQAKPLTFKPYMESGKFWIGLAPKLFRWVAKEQKVADSVLYTINYKPQKKNAFKGKVFILTNGNTFSAAAYLASYLKQLAKATVIGEETGGSGIGTNAMLFVFIKLPATKVYVRFPLYRVNYLLPITDNKKGITPDYAVTYTWEEWLQKQDKEMQKVYELVGKE